MDYAKSFTFVFDDPRWVTKVAIGAGLVLVSSLLSLILIGVLGFLILAGYSIRLLQNVREGEEFPLPEWDDWGGDFVRGVKFAVVGIVWVLPMIVFVVPMTIGGIIADGNSAAEFVGISIVFCTGCLMVLYGLFVALATPGFSIAYATDERINSGLQFTEIWHWTQANIGHVVIAVLVVLLATFVIGLVGSIAGAILCLIGTAVTLPLAGLATSIYQYHVYGQLAYEFPFGGIGGSDTIAPYGADVLATDVTEVVEQSDEEEQETQGTGDDEEQGEEKTE